MHKTLENKSGEIINTATLRAVRATVGASYTTSGKVTVDAEALGAEAFHAIVWDYARLTDATIGKGGNFVLRAMAWASDVHPEFCSLVAAGEIARKNREIAQYQAEVK